MSTASADNLEDLLEDPAEFRALRHQHQIMLVLSGVIILLACLLTTDNRDVALPGLAQFPLPEVCQSRRWLNLECPGCGLTRSFIHFFHGRWEQSLEMHRLGWLMALLTILQIPYRLVALKTPSLLPLGSVFPKAIGFGLIALLCLTWVFKACGL